MRDAEARAERGGHHERVTTTESPSSHHLRVVVVAGQEMIARCLELALPKASGGRIEVVGTAGTVADAVATIDEHSPDVALINLDLPDPGALELVRTVGHSHPDVRLIGITDHEDIELAGSALALGIHGLITNSEQPEHLLAPVLGVLQGWRILSAPVLEGLLARSRRPGAEMLAEIDDTTRQLWLLVAEGLELVQIAETLHVSERTAKRMVADLRDRLGARTRIEMAALAGRAGLLDEDSGNVLPARPDRTTGGHSPDH